MYRSYYEERGEIDVAFAVTLLASRAVPPKKDGNEDEPNEQTNATYCTVGVHSQYSTPYCSVFYLGRNLFTYHISRSDVL